MNQNTAHEIALNILSACKFTEKGTYTYGAFILNYKIEKVGNKFTVSLYNDTNHKDIIHTDIICFS